MPEDGKPPDPSDGCPAASDRDGDGIPDSADKCPDDPEDKDGIQDNDGCPEDDADNDGIPDKDDKCPTEPGPKNTKDPEKNGCPRLTKVTEEGEVALLEPIQFEFGKATIKAVSFPILDEVVTLMKSRAKHPHRRVRPHRQRGRRRHEPAAQQGSRCSPSELPRRQGHRRLTRLESEGFGETKPIDTNDTRGRPRQEPARRVQDPERVIEGGPAAIPRRRPGRRRARGGSAWRRCATQLHVPDGSTSYPAALASHALAYLTPLQPHTLEPPSSGKHVAGRATHVPLEP